MSDGCSTTDRMTEPNDDRPRQVQQQQPPAPRVRLAYRLVPDDYRGGSAIQLIVEHREAC
jgi:hypothetical protein